MKIFYSFLIFLIFSCTQNDDVPIPALGSGGVDSLAVTGLYSNCHTNLPNEFGSDLNGMSFLRKLYLRRNGSYSLSVDLYSSVDCQTSGTDIFSYVQSGTFSTGGVMSTPAGATQFVFTVLQSTLYSYGATSPGSKWALYLNEYCPGSSLGLSSDSITSVNVPAVHCIHDSHPNFSLPTFTAIGAVLYDSIILNATTPQSLSTGPIQSIFEQGQGNGYPTSATFIYTE